ncbi:MAG TPA: winged helix-turn-helix domain-containing protein [Pseudonocardiaceae bacterium]|jgi:DNA-binding transcriptional ArsR family regulator|nr:winged helix-turn-helix domain-containing protein [Pseudonocardiaceae bacterium]
MARVLASAEDLARMRFAAAPAPLMETGLAIADLQRRPRNALPRWAAAFPDTARPLLDLIPAKGFGPQFLDPMAVDLDEAVAMVLATPRRFLRADLMQSWTNRPGRPVPPLWVRTLADGDRESLDLVVGGLRDFYLACIAPQWTQVRATFRRDVDSRLPVLATEGFTGLFATLHPRMRFQDGAFSKPGPSRVIELNGDGLQLMPSAFWRGLPAFAIRPAVRGGNALIYPADPITPGEVTDPEPVTPRTATAERLADLLGRTRAAALHALRQPRTTTDLAGQLAISLASASEHTRTLRAANLVRTTRHGRSVRHSLTPLGHQLLDAE